MRLDSAIIVDTSQNQATLKSTNTKLNISEDLQFCKADLVVVSHTG